MTILDSHPESRPASSRLRVTGLVCVLSRHILVGTQCAPRRAAPSPAQPVSPSRLGIWGLAHPWSFGKYLSMNQEQVLREAGEGVGS